MASVFNLPNGRKGVELYSLKGERFRVRLGKVNQKTADAYAANINRLVAAIRNNLPDADALRWADGLDKDVRDVLEDAGLVPPLKARTLRELINHFTPTLKMKPGSRLRLMTSLNTLAKHFGDDCDPKAVTPLLASEYRVTLALKLAEATIAKRIKDARQIFAWAVRFEIVSKSPFTDVRPGNDANPERNFFVTREMTDKVMEKCPDVQWRLLIALSRYGGLRCPSEHLALQWDDILWDQGKFRVREGKTKERWVKLFDELEPYLLAAQSAAAVGEPFVITRYRKSSANLRTLFHKIIRRAGMTPWPRTFHNLRASRQTELVEEYPAHIACAWIGNSEAVARKHYLMVPDYYYADVAKGGGRLGERGVVLSGSTSSRASKLMAQNENNAGRAASEAADQPQQFPHPPAPSIRNDVFRGRRGENWGELESLSDSERMDRAQAIIRIQSELMRRKAGGN